MDQLKKCIEEAIKVNKTLTSLPAPIGVADKQFEKVPTLEPGVYRKASPMLMSRFQMLGYWKNATHGDWLSLTEMESLWANNDSSYIENIKEQIVAVSENWANDACALFKKNRITIYAAEGNGYERIYIVWFDEVEEPELWVYDTNGMARYKNLLCYLKAYLNDDLSAYNNSWIIGL